MDMEEDIFAKQSYGELALKKMAPVPENFRLYSAAWLDKDPRSRTVMEVTGAQFRVALRGPNKGKLSVMVPGTQRSALVTAAEMQRSI